MLRVCSLGLPNLEVWIFKDIASCQDAINIRGFMRAEVGASAIRKLEQTNNQHLKK